ncbi:MAG: Gfo/Idh/MocA family oxidoreductase [Actinomycetota bacterium]
MVAHDPANPAPAPLRFGILGAARIAPKALIEPVAKLATATVSRVAARDHDRATEFAATHGVDNVAADYRALIDADDVDVVYNPLPMSLHADWTIAALRAGKHVFCEKPFAANAEEAAAMIAAADETGMVLGEAFHYRYHPMWLRILDLVDSGTIGTINRVEANFNITIGKPDLRWDYETAGGATMDLGCYPVHWVRDLLGEPTVTDAFATADSDDPLVDADLTMDLRWESGATGRVRSSMIAEVPDISLRIEGSSGEVIAANPMAPQNGNVLTVTTERGTTSGPVDAGISYDHMVRAFVDHVCHGSAFPTRGQDSVNNMAVIDAAYRSAGLPERGRTEPV